MQSNAPLTISEPAVIYEPSICFTFDAYEVVDIAGLTPEWLTVSGKDIIIESRDQSLVTSSPFTLSITTKLSNNDLIQQHNFDVIFVDSCLVD